MEQVLERFPMSTAPMESEVSVTVTVTVTIDSLERPELSYPGKRVEP